MSSVGQPSPCAEEARGLTVVLSVGQPTPCAEEAREERPRGEVREEWLRLKSAEEARKGGREESPRGEPLAAVEPLKSAEEARKESRWLRLKC